MTLELNTEQPIIPQLIDGLKEAGFSISKIAMLLGVSRATLYNRYLSKDKYLERKKRVAITPKTHIVVSKGGRPKGSKNKIKKEKPPSYWTQEEIRELMKIFGKNYKQIAACVKAVIKKENKNLEVLKRLAKKFSGKPVEYICKAIRGGAYYEEMHKLTDEKWAEKQKEIEKKEKEITPEMIAESDKIIMEKLGWMINPKLEVKTNPFIDEEKELESFCRRYGIDVEEGKRLWREL